MHHYQYQLPDELLLSKRLLHVINIDPQGKPNRAILRWKEENIVLYYNAFFVKAFQYVHCLSSTVQYFTYVSAIIAGLIIYLKSLVSRHIFQENVDFNQLTPMELERAPCNFP